MAGEKRPACRRSNWLSCSSIERSSSSGSGSVLNRPRATGAAGARAASARCSREACAVAGSPALAHAETTVSSSCRSSASRPSPESRAFGASAGHCWPSPAWVPRSRRPRSRCARARPADLRPQSRSARLSRLSQSSVRFRIATSHTIGPRSSLPWVSRGRHQINTFPRAPRHQELAARICSTISNRSDEAEPGAAQARRRPGRIKRNCGSSLPLFQCAWKALARS